ncbi:hypothetical protein ABZP36_034796 [Zizania latifolia]
MAPICNGNTPIEWLVVSMAPTAPPWWEQQRCILDLSQAFPSLACVLSPSFWILRQRTVRSGQGCLRARWAIAVIDGGVGGVATGADGRGARQSRRHRGGA